MMKKDELEDMFKDSFENFEADVNPGVWKNIQTGLKGAGLGLLGKMLMNKIGSNAIVAIVSSAAAVVATVLVMNGTSNQTKETTPQANSEPKIIVDTQKPSVDEIKDFLATDNNVSKQEVVVQSESNEKETKNTNGTLVIKKDKKAIEALLSDNNIASISSSCVGGAVPLIINLSNIGTGKINKWTFNDGTKPMTGANPVKYFDVPGLYTITLTSTSADGKTSVDSLKIEVTGNSSLPSMPAEFSPNGDGVNDVFVFQSKNIVNMSAKIYDRNGSVVYDYTGTDGKWDGKNKKGEKVKPGIYLYVILADGVDGKKYEQNGKINLTR
ncbi:MAG: gliding motility-associated C-terminal domain-containing protein [Bacteroidetes bacterium]|nr:gliding motility-associated C-terminal domain-containing protein [Bacteroidota bacterium]